MVDFEVAEAMESQVDAELKKLDKLDEDGLEAIRRRRIEGLKKLREQKEVRTQAVTQGDEGLAVA